MGKHTLLHPYAFYELIERGWLKLNTPLRISVYEWKIIFSNFLTNIIKKTNLGTQPYCAKFYTLQIDLGVIFFIPVEASPSNNFLLGTHMARQYYITTIF